MGKCPISMVKRSSYKFSETGKVVIVLAGRHAGKKAVVVKTFDEGNSEKRFSHCLVAGLARNPRKVTKAMSKSKVEKRTKCMKPFVKYINSLRKLQYFLNSLREASLPVSIIYN